MVRCLPRMWISVWQRPHNSISICTSVAFNDGSVTSMRASRSPAAWHPYAFVFNGPSIPFSFMVFAFSPQSCGRRKHSQRRCSWFYLLFFIFYGQQIMGSSFVSLATCEQKPFAMAKHDTLVRVSLSENAARPPRDPRPMCLWSRNLRISCFVSRQLICDLGAHNFKSIATGYIP